MKVKIKLKERLSDNPRVWNDSTLTLKLTCENNLAAKVHKAIINTLNEKD